MSEGEGSPLIGQEIGGKYRIVRLLGEGGMGAVYLGEQKLGSTLRKVAIKTLHPHLSHDPKIKARFERECSTVAELQHPNTIQIYDFGETPEGTLYIVMEYVEGRSVGEILEKEGPMDPPRVLKIMQQVCGSLEEAHSRGIVHRDLKPDNVVLCERAGQKDWVEVLDFGIAKRSSEHDPSEEKLTQQGMVLGTPPYMSPEQFTGKPIDARSDIYSLGVMAYEMLTGRLPFSGNTAWEWATQHMTARPVAIESLPAGTRVPSAMRSAINRSLAKQPEERFSTVKEFVEAFTSDAQGASYSAPPPDASARQKTEMAPMQQPPGVYVPPQSAPQNPMMGPAPAPAFGPPPMMAPAAAPYVTPASGNQAFASAPEPKKGPPRGLIFGAIGVLGLGSVALVLAGLGVFSGDKKPDPSTNIFGNPTNGTTVTQTPAIETTTSTTTPTASDTPTAASTVAPLDPAKPPTKPATKPPPAQSTSPVQSTPPPVTPPPVTPPPKPPVTPTPVTPPPKPPVTPPPVTPPPKPVIPECTEAARWCKHAAVNVDKAIQSRCVQFKQACFAKGGNF